MKKSLILALTMVMPAMAGTVTVVDPSPAPVPAPKDTSCAVEIAGMYRFASRDLSSVNKSIDTYGVDLTAVHSLDANNAVTLRFGYAYGSEVYREAGFSMHEHVENFSIMPGYRFTQPIDDNLSVFAGANVGIVWGTLDASLTDFNADLYATDREWGWGASAEVGLRYQICPEAYVFAAYELSGNNIKYDYKTTHKQIYHGVRVGVGFSF